MEESFDFQKTIANNILMREQKKKEQRDANINTMIGYIYEHIIGLFDRAVDLISNGEIEFHGQISYTESFWRLTDSGNLSSDEGIFEDYNHVVPEVLKRLNNNYRRYVSIVTGTYNHSNEFNTGFITSDTIFKIDITSTETPNDKTTDNNVDPNSSSFERDLPKFEFLAYLGSYDDDLYDSYPSACNSDDDTPPDFV